MTIVANSQLEIRRGTSGDFVDLSASARGVAGWNATDTNRSRPIPSILGVLTIQRLSVRDGNVTFTVDDNELTHPLLFMQSGEEFQVRETPVFGQSANTLYTGIATINLQNIEGGVRQFQFSMTVTSVTYTS